MIKNKKAAFGAYMWFLLVLALFMFTFALISLYEKYSNAESAIIGDDASNYHKVASEEELIRTQVEQLAKITSDKAFLELSRKGGVGSYKGSYMRAPILHENIKKSFSNKPRDYIEKSSKKDFISLFSDKFEDELKQQKLDIKYDKNAYSIASNTLYGYAEEEQKITKTIKDKNDLDVGIAHARFYPHFKHKFNTISIDSFKEAINFVYSVIIPKLNDLCKSNDYEDSCIKDVFNNINSANPITQNTRFKIKDKSDYMEKILPSNQYSQVYETSHESLIMYNLIPKIKDCFSKNGAYFCKINLDDSLANILSSPQSIYLEIDNFLVTDINDKSELIDNSIENTEIISYSDQDNKKADYIKLKVNKNKLRDVSYTIELHDKDDDDTPMDRIETKGYIYIYKIGQRVSFMTKKDFNKFRTHLNNPRIYEEFSEKYILFCLEDTQTKIPTFNSDDEFRLINPCYPYAIEMND